MATATWTTKPAASQVSAKQGWSIRKGGAPFAAPPTSAYVIPTWRVPPFALYSGSGTLSVTVQSSLGKIGALNGSGSLAATRAQFYTSRPGIVGLGALVAAAFQRLRASPVAVTGDGALTVDILAGLGTLVQFTGSGALAAVVELGGVKIPFAAAGSLAASAFPGIPSTADGLSAWVYPIYPQLVSLAGDGALTGMLTGQLVNAYPFFSGIGNLTAVLAPVLGALAALGGDGALSAQAYQLVPIPVAADLVGSGTITAIPDSGHHYTDDFSSGVYTPDVRSAGLSGGGALSATALLQYPRSAALNGGGTLSATAVAPARVTTSITQSNVYSSNTAATYAGMNNDTGVESTETGMNNVAGNFIQAQLSGVFYVSYIIVGYPGSTLAGGWSESYLEGLTVQGYDQSLGWINLTTIPTLASFGYPADRLGRVPINHGNLSYIKILGPSSGYMAITEFSVWAL